MFKSVIYYIVYTSNIHPYTCNGGGMGRVYIHRVITLIHSVWYLYIYNMNSTHNKTVGDGRKMCTQK